MYYNNCSLPTQMDNRELKKMGINKVVVCKDPSTAKAFSTVLQQFSPLPGSHGGLVYLPGTTYYFISEYKTPLRNWSV